MVVSLTRFLDVDSKKLLAKTTLRIPLLSRLVKLLRDSLTEVTLVSQDWVFDLVWVAQLEQHRL